MIDANKMITVTLSASHMDAVMRGLYGLTYGLAEPVVNELRRQIQEAEPQAFDIAAAVAPRVNGIDVRE
jgi:hypothetical protein